MKVTILVKDIKDEKLAEIKKTIGEFWHEGMLTQELATIGEEPVLEEGSLGEALKGMIEKLGSKGDRIAELTKRWAGESPEEKSRIRRILKEQGHDCPTCTDAECPLHPFNDEPDYEAKAH